MLGQKLPEDWEKHMGRLGKPRRQAHVGKNTQPVNIHGWLAREKSSARCSASFCALACFNRRLQSVGSAYADPVATLRPFGLASDQNIEERSGGARARTHLLCQVVLILPSASLRDITETTTTFQAKAAGVTLWIHMSFIFVFGLCLSSFLRLSWPCHIWDISSHSLLWLGAPTFTFFVLQPHKSVAFGLGC